MIYLYALLSRALIHMPFLSLYLGSKGLSTEEIILFFSIYPLAILLLEFPTGLLADKYGDLWAMRLSKVILASSIPLFIFCDTLYAIILCQIIWAFSDALVSGADQAYFYRLFKHKNLDYDKFSGLYGTLAWSGVCFSFFLSYFLSSINIESVFYAFFIISLINIAICFSFDEFNQKCKCTSNENILYSLKKNLDNKSLLLLILISACVVAALGASYSIIQPYMEEIDIAGPLNGVYFGFATVFSVLASYSKLLIDKMNKYSEYYMTCLLLIIAIILFSFSILNDFWLFIVFFSLYRFIWGLYTPLSMRSLNAAIVDDRSRSSLLSLHSTIFNFIQFLLLAVVSLSQLRPSLSLAVIGFVLSLSSIMFFINIKGKSSNKCMNITG